MVSSMETMLTVFLESGGARLHALQASSGAASVDREHRQDGRLADTSRSSPSDASSVESCWELKPCGSDGKGILRESNIRTVSTHTHLTSLCGGSSCERHDWYSSRAGQADSAPFSCIRHEGREA